MRFVSFSIKFYEVHAPLLQFLRGSFAYPSSLMRFVRLSINFYKILAHLHQEKVEIFNIRRRVRKGKSRCQHERKVQHKPKCLSWGKIPPMGNKYLSKKDDDEHIHVDNHYFSLPQT
ncbi:hypothetical protein V8G54_029334 [Vigna mungo]|uniref:Uncharacterized protein n=1 Tax=Vigna mungo TaxID=3915 RepID=A0AAQ3RLQ6_VIGMU